jgi:hypothetical protein
MDQDTYNNWKKIKDVMEESGKTDNYYYKRAVAILKTGVDPLDNFLGHNK